MRDTDKKNISSSYFEMMDYTVLPFVVLHNTIGKKMIPLCCNEAFYAFTGLTEEEYLSKSGNDVFCFVHPDDQNSFSMLHKQALDADDTLQLILRIRKADGDYSRMKAVGRSKAVDDGYDMFIMLLDATDEEYLNRQRMEHYQLFNNRWHSFKNDNNYSIRLNLTQNICMDCVSDIRPLYEIRQDGSVEAFLSDFAKNIDQDSYRRVFEQNFSLQELTKSFNTGKTKNSIELPMKIRDDLIHWYNFSTESIYAPETGDIEVIASLISCDTDARLRCSIDRLMASDYEFMGLIDTFTGFLSIFGVNSDKDTVDTDYDRKKYEEYYKQRLQKIVVPEYYEEATQKLSIEAIKEALETSDTYLCSFLCVDFEDGKERLCQWRCGYIGTHRKLILVTRVNSSKFKNNKIDILTGLLNQNGFLDAAKEILDSNPEKTFGVIRMDFDGFKLYNEEHGYASGDRFLRRFAADISLRIKQEGVLCLAAHIWGDHFAFLYDDSCTNPELLYENLTAKINTYPEAYRLAVSMGVFPVNDRSLPVETMCEGSALALKSVKGSFVNHIGYYTNNLRETLIDEQILTSEMQKALEDGQFEIWFQPQVNHEKNGSLIGAEALVRWRHPERGLLSPAIFIPLFEKNGFVYELDKFVWKQSCEYLRKWTDEGRLPIPISVNISRFDITQPNFFDTITAIVKNAGISLDLLHLEITESACNEETGLVIEMLNKLIDYGFTVAIDDFGSELSSLSLLKNVPAQILKLDLRFFSGSEGHLHSECIIESVVRMSKILGMGILAEGVEKQQQADFLKTVGCSYIQGFLYSKPMCAEDYESYSKQDDHSLTDSHEGKELVDSPESDPATDVFCDIITDTDSMVFVLDFNTRKLLYANRKAEQFYGKNFDPMTLIRCYQFRDKNEICDYCQIENIEPGCSCDEEINEKGHSFFVRHKRLEWNGHDAIAIYQNDITSERKEAELVRTLVQDNPDAMAIFSETDGEIYRIFVSDAAKNMLGFSGDCNEKILLEDLFSPVYSDDIDYLHGQVNYCVTQKTPLRSRFRISNTDGAVRWIEMRTTPVQQNDGSFLYYVSYSDISEEKKMQDIVRYTPSGMHIYHLSAPMHLEYANEGLCKMLGYSPEEFEKISDNSYTVHIPQEDQQIFIDFASTLAEKIGKETVEYRMLCKDGSIIYVSDTMESKLDADGVVRGYSSVTDITKLKEVEKEMLSQQEVLSIVIAQSGKSMMVYDLAADSIIESNINFDFFGVPSTIKVDAEAIIATGLVLPESFDDCRRFVENMYNGKVSSSADFHLKKANGTTGWYHGDYTLQADANGKYTCAIISFSNVTEQIEQKLLYEQRTKEIALLTRDCDFYFEGNVNRWCVENIQVVSKRAAPAASANGREIYEFFENEMRKVIYPEDYDSAREFLTRHRIRTLVANGVVIDRLDFRINDGESFAWRCMELHLLHSAWNDEINFLVIFKNINDIHTLHEELVSQATTDKLTNLLNRDSTMHLIEDFLLNEGADGTHALFMVDFDNLKKLNDTLGHQAGDAALQHFGQIMKNSVRSSDIVGRIGGDEFFVLLKDISTDKVAEKAKELVGNLQASYSNASGQVMISASIGIAMYYGKASKVKSLSELYAQADVALYKSKTAGKARYTFADDADALAASDSSTILKDETISYSLRGLFNNLGSGVAIYHSEQRQNFVPTFCNERFLELLNISYEQFFDHSNRHAFVHPDDMEQVKQAYAEAASTGKSTQLTYRAFDGNNESHWVSVFINAHYLNDGSIDFYVIYSDADEAMRNRQAQAKRYNIFIERERIVASKRAASIRFNLTQNSCSNMAFAVNTYLPLDTSSAETFLRSVEENIDSDNKRKEFNEKFNTKALIKAYSEGFSYAQLAVPFLLEDGRRVWCRLSVDMIRNPFTGDIEAVGSFEDADRELRIQSVTDKMIKTDYESIAELDIRTGMLRAIKANKMLKYGNGEYVIAPYTDCVMEAMNKLVAPNYLDEAICAMDQKRIIAELDRHDSYTVTMPARNPEHGYNGLYQWRCSYVDEDKKSIMILRGPMIVFSSTNCRTNLSENGQPLSASRSKILVADDDEFTRAILNITFAEDYELIEAIDGEDAIEKIDKYHSELALIILDNMMPKKTGLDVMVHLNARGLLDAVPIILLTADISDEKRLIFYGYHVADIITKPIDRPLLRKRSLEIIDLYDRIRNTVPHSKEFEQTE